MTTNCIPKILLRNQERCMLSASISKSWSTVRTADGNHQSGVAQPNSGSRPCGARQNAMNVFCSQTIPPSPRCAPEPLHSASAQRLLAAWALLQQFRLLFPYVITVSPSAIPKREQLCIFLLYSMKQWVFFFLICNGDAENTPASIKLLPLTTAGLQQATACPHFQQHCCTLIFH